MSPTLVSYLVGAAGVRVGGFMLALIATVPGIVVMVYFGVESTHLVDMSARSDGGITARDIVQIGGLLVSIVALVIVTRSAVRAVNRAVDSQER